jgi:hypothetical protein
VCENSDASVHIKPLHLEGAVVVVLEHTEPASEDRLGRGGAWARDVVKQSAG